jgi:hypothetical protein
MDNGSETLDKILDRVRNMTIEEYEKIYEKVQNSENVHALRTEMLPEMKLNLRES